MHIGTAEKINSLLKEINAILNRRLRNYLRKLGLTIPQTLVLTVLHETGEMKISDISNALNLADSTVSGIIDRLEKMGYVERFRLIEDRRVVKVRLTDKVSNIAKDIKANMEEFFSSILSRASQDDINCILDGLIRFRELLLRPECPV